MKHDAGMAAPRFGEKLPDHFALPEIELERGGQHENLLASGGCGFVDNLAERRGRFGFARRGHRRELHPRLES